MMMRRRPLLRAAVVGGGAYYAGKKAAQGSAQRAEQDERIGNLEEQQSAGSQQPATGAQPSAAGQPAPGAQAPEMLDQLNQLTTLHQQGALTDDEFAAAKAKLLGTLARRHDLRRALGLVFGNLADRDMAALCLAG